MSMNKQDRIKQIAKQVQQHKPFVPCLGCGGEAKLNYKTALYSGGIEDPSPQGKIGSNYESFSFYCSNCLFNSGAFINLQASISMWHRDNYPTPENKKSWLEKYNYQINAQEGAQ